MLDTINGAMHEAEVDFDSFKEALGEAVSPQVITTFHGVVRGAFRRPGRLQGVA